MTKKNHVSKFALVGSVVALVLCFAMLFGTTYAWFSDTVSSGRNNIIGGNLDVDLEYSADMQNWTPVTATTKIFAESHEPGADGAVKEDNLWEPGHVEVAYLRVSNPGTLALKYQVSGYFTNEVKGTNKANQQFAISDFLKVGAVDVTAVFANRDAAVAAVEANAVDLADYSIAKENVQLLPGQTDNVFALVIYMPEATGNEANPIDPEHLPSLELGVTLLATQTPYEDDSFDDQYDADADGKPDIPGGFQMITVMASTSAEVLDAIANAPTDGTPVTIQLTADMPQASGFKVNAGQNITLDLNGYTYDATIPTVGSTGTETNGCQLLKGSTVTIKNGTFECNGQNANGNIAIQNYCDLTLEDVIVDCSGVAVPQYSYALSNNCGHVTIKGNTQLINPDGVAFDLWYGMFPTYDVGVYVTFDESFTGRVEGNIEYGATTAAMTRNPDWHDSCVLVIRGNGTFVGQIVAGNTPLDDTENISIYGGTFTPDANPAYVK